MAHYDIVEEAIVYLIKRADKQLDLEEVAAHVEISAAHFRCVFEEWAGVGPEKFDQFVTLMRAKHLFRKNKQLIIVADKVGLSSSSYLHDIFVTIEGMTPAEYKNGGDKLTIKYSFSDTPYGRTIVASTRKGVCYLAFSASDEEAKGELRKMFPKAVLRAELDVYHQMILDFFNGLASCKSIKLHLKGTPFQLKVWHALLQIPEGDFSTYSRLAQIIEMPSAARAVGNAVGANPVAYIIPCHRVLRESGALGGYRWGAERKRAMLFRENIISRSN